MTASWKPRDIGLAVASIALVLDQTTKLFMLYGVGLFYFRPGQRIPLLPFFNLVMVWNPGISYGLFPAHGPLQVTLLILATLAIVGWLGWWLFRTDSRLTAAGLGLAIGGAIGNNLIDRPVYGRVADFFHFYLGRFDWYVFNVADAAITFGMIALLYEALKLELSELRARRSAG
jgi:signal peptidase II